jgi:hypothetical protein
MLRMLVAVVVLLVVSCADDEAGETGPELTELAPLFAEAICGEIHECGGETFLAEQLGGENCVATVTAEMEDKAVVELGAAVDAGSVVYRASNVDPCMSALRKTGCSILTRRINQLEGCKQVFEGNVEVGGDCDIDESCGGDAYCQRTTTCPGKCAERSAEGEDCSRNEECKDGLTCNEQGQCEAPSEEGDTCGGASPGCGLGQICVGAVASTGAPGQCKPNEEAFVAKEGDACDPSGSFCEPALSCAAMPGMLGPEWTCKQPAKSGGACSLAVPSQCPQDEFCDGKGALQGECQPLPKAGEACRNEPMMVGSACAPGLLCGSDDACREPGRIGEACGADGDCVSGLCEDDKCAEPELCELP